MKQFLLTKLFALLISTALLAQTPDWSTSVASIIYDNCSVCHHEGAIAPFPLMSYDDALLHGFSIQAYVNSKAMPPWPPDPDYNHLAEEKVLSDEEINTINEWVNNYMPAGDLTIAPDPPAYNGNVIMQAPDDTIILPVIEITTNEDVHIGFTVHSDYTETKYINQIEFVAGNPAIVHHAIYHQDTSNVSWMKDENYPGPGFPSYPADNGPYAESFGAYIPGQGLLKFPLNMGLEILPGADYMIIIHYPAGSLGQIDSSKIYLKFSDDPNVRPIYGERYLFAVPPCLTNGPLFIPANTVATFNEHSTLPFERTMIGLMPHSHLICKSWEVKMVPTPGDTVPLVYIPKWDFGWQYSYLLTKALKISIGTQFFGEAVFDNTVNNPDNPNNPPLDIEAGASTFDEMMACRFWVMDYQPGDEDIILDSSFYGYPTTAEPVKKELSLKIFPNPANKSIHFTALLTGNDVSWSLTDLFGQIRKAQHEKNIPGGLYERKIDVSDLPGGVYLLTLKSNEQSANLKVIVSR